jgi:hypothetical protein
MQAITQRMLVSIIGLTWPTAIFPATEFPPQIKRRDAEDDIGLKVHGDGIP